MLLHLETCSFEFEREWGVRLTTNPSREETVKDQSEADGADWVLKGYLSTHAIVEKACIGGVPGNAGGE